MLRYTRYHCWTFAVSAAAKYRKAAEAALPSPAAPLEAPAFPTGHAAEGWEAELQAPLVQEYGSDRLKDNVDGNKQKMKKEKEQRPRRRFVLPYKLKRAAASEMLYGGVRTTDIRSVPPAVVETKSELMRLPTYEEHFQRSFAWEDLQRYMMPVNLGQYPQQLMVLHKNIDLLRQHKENLNQAYHTPPSATPLTPNEASAAQLQTKYKGRALPRFLPLQSLKPADYPTHISSRGQGLRTQHQNLKGERLNAKGEGEKTQQKKLWDQDHIATYRDVPFRPWQRNNTFGSSA